MSLFVSLLEITAVDWATPTTSVDVANMRDYNLAPKIQVGYITKWPRSVRANGSSTAQ